MVLMAQSLTPILKIENARKKLDTVTTRRSGWAQPHFTDEYEAEKDWEEVRSK